MHQGDRIEPEWQHLKVGDQLFFAVGGATTPAMAATVAGVVPERALWLRGGWAFVLQPIDASSTRLIVRYTLHPDVLVYPLLSYTIFEPAHFVMESGMLLGIKRRAERDPLLRTSGVGQ